ncbi:hypothetical protein [Halorhabdus sp. BNX81]|uniref:hypothetical protein n=1 Tax=Halorhabdus sp. BNX81 TaxID=2980181 RepID=UPI0023DD5554|nr:hypothetical protein [Halorhabdus sp. BNX81]WEL21424.1 putative membrane protein [Halorhabdus sp. BNX81]
MSGRVATLGANGAKTLNGDWLDDIDREVLALPAVIAAGTLFVSRVAINARAEVPIDLVALQEWLVPLTAMACAGSLLAIAVVHGKPFEMLGLAFVGVFGVAGSVARPAYTPTVVAIVVGTPIALGDRLRTDEGVRVGPALVTGVLLSGLVASLAGTLGVDVALSRSLGSQLTLVGVAGTPVFLARGRGDWLVGAVGAGLLVALGVFTPFLLGATGLVAGAVVGATVPVMALAVGGLTTTASAALRTRHRPALLGAGLLLFAGIPATVPRALPFILALTLLVGSVPGGVGDD